MAFRKRTGQRRHTAIFAQHDGSVDASGLPTYDDPAKWSAVGGRWPCELISTNGSEVLRGRQVTSLTRYVLFGDHAAVAEINTEMRVTINGRLYNILAAYDPDGLGVDMRVELGVEL